MNLDFDARTVGHELIPRSLCSLASPLEGATHLGQHLLQELAREMSIIKELAPHWFADYEDSDPITAPLQEVQELLMKAPTDFSRGLLAGIMMFRQQLAILTDRG